MAADETPLLLRQPLVNLGRSDVADDDVQESPPLSPELCTQPVPRALAGDYWVCNIKSRSLSSPLPMPISVVPPRSLFSLPHLSFLFVFLSPLLLLPFLSLSISLPPSLSPSPSSPPSLPPSPLSLDRSHGLCGGEVNRQSGEQVQCHCL